MSSPRFELIVAPPIADYGLIDSGHGRKLERYGSVRLIRPEPQAMWAPRQPSLWASADAEFQSAADDDERGKWSSDPGPIPLSVAGAQMVCRLGNNHHTGLFPEQHPHWAAAAGAVERAASTRTEPPEVLNLFGYTGAASLILAAAGARVTHVDASKKANAWARENQAASGLDAAPIRWICDDAQKFVAREVRRGRRYHGILLDPPKFGRGPKNEVFNLFDDLPPLIEDVAKLVHRDALFVILTAYAIRASALSIGRLLTDALAPRPVRYGELALQDEAGALLPTSMFALWMAD